MSDSNYLQNLEFWEQAWLRVKNISHKIPENLSYLLEIPEVFLEHNCKSILDLACGSGWLSFLMAARGLRVCGLDISQSAIRLANQALKDNPQENLSFIQGDILDLRFLASGNFDGVLLNACLEHLDYQRAELCLNNLAKTLQQNSLMFGIFDKVASGNRGEYKILEDGTFQYTDKFRNGMFLRNYSDDELLSLLSGAGWEITKIKYNNYGARIIFALNNSKKFP